MSEIKDKAREKIEAILNRSETADIVPPWSCLPVGHPDWIRWKATQILAMKEIAIVDRDGKLPEGGKCYGEHSVYEVPDTREEIVFHTQEDMLKAGYVKEVK